MERKLIALDIDGTLLNSQKEPLNSTLKGIRELRKAGHLVTIATGRSRLLANEVIHQLACGNYVVCNGSAAFLEHEQVYQHLLDREALARLIDYASSKQIDTVLFGLDSVGRVTDYNFPLLSDAMKSFGGPLPPLDPDFLTEHNVYQGCLYFDESSDAEFKEAFPEFRFVRWHKNSVDIVPRGGSKAETILALAKKVGIEQKNVIAFGDGNNDIEMLRTAGFGVAMGNASANVQAAADIVTDTNDHDGIWNALVELELV